MYSQDELGNSMEKGNLGACHPKSLRVKAMLNREGLLLPLPMNLGKSEHIVDIGQKWRE